MFVIEQIDSTVFIAIGEQQRKPKSASQFKLPRGESCGDRLTDGSGKREASAGRMHPSTAVDRIPIHGVFF